MIAGIGESDIGSAGIHGDSMFVLTTVGGSVHHLLRATRRICWQLLEQTKRHPHKLVLRLLRRTGSTFGRKLKMRWKGAFK